MLNQPAVAPGPRSAIRSSGAIARATIRSAEATVRERLELRHREVARRARHAT